MNGSFNHLSHRTTSRSNTSNAVAGPSHDRIGSALGTRAFAIDGKSTVRDTNTSVSPSRAGALEDPFCTTTTYSAFSSSTHAFNNHLLQSPTSPSKKRNYGDRFIPNREGVDLSASYQLMGDGPSTPTRGSGIGKRKVVAAVTDLEREEANRTFSALLRSETFGTDPAEASNLHLLSPSRSRQPSTAPPSSPGTPRRGGTGNLFSYASPSRTRTVDLDSPTHERYGTSPVRYESQQLLQSPRRPHRCLSKVPFKVLDAPDLADDYYLNLLDWSSTNILAVGLGSQVYLWNGSTSAVARLCDLNAGQSTDFVTSLSWVGKGNTLAIGCDSGKIQIWDAAQEHIIRTMSGHTARVGCMDWNDYILTTGSRDHNILHRDVRVAPHFVGMLLSHKQEVCGLKWNVETKQLATGGNDNKLFIWDRLTENPLHRFTEHTAAIKALAWNPHQNGVLASGGGTADKRIRFWNTLTGSMLNEIDTGSQVCSLMWSKTSNELVSTHGFGSGPILNQVCLWKFPSMQQVATLSGHTFRVLYLAMSPDGQTIVTGAGDETLRFWSAFPKSKLPNRKVDTGSASMNPFIKMR